MPYRQFVRSVRQSLARGRYAVGGIGTDPAQLLEIRGGPPLTAVEVLYPVGVKRLQSDPGGELPHLVERNVL